jgi:hypothetical protein
MIKLFKKFVRKIEELNRVPMFEYGITTGDICKRPDGHIRVCPGIITKVDGSCTCHTGNPPCGYCVDAPHYCNVCDWDEQNYQGE